MDFKKEFTNKVNELFDLIIKEVKDNKEFMGGMAVGAFLTTPAGRKLLSKSAYLTKQIAALTKEVGANTAKELWQMAVTSKLGKTNLMVNATKGVGKVGTMAKGATQITAAMAAGKILGASLGKTIAAGKDWWQHVNPVSMMVDTVQVLKEEHDEKKAENLKVNEPVKQLAEQMDKYSVSGEPNKISAHTGFNYDSEAAKLGLSKRPSHPQAENEWKKEVERKMKNHPDWYTKVPVAITSNLNWGVRKEYDYFDIAVGCQVTMGLTIPTKEGKVAQTYKDAINIIYSKVRGSNSGAFNYNPEDLAAYIECVRSIVALHDKICRDVQLVNNIELYESKTPYPLLRVAGYTTTEIDDLIANRADYVAELNRIANVIPVKYPLPPAMTVVERTRFISRCILKDSKAPKASYLVYKLEQVFKATPNADTIEGVIISGNIGAQITILRTLMDAADAYASTLSSYTFAKIAGDLLKAYGERSLYSCSQSNLTSPAPVAYDEYMLHQIQNSTAAVGISNPTIAAATPFNFTLTGDIYVTGDNTYTVAPAKIPGLKDGVSGTPAIIPVNTNKTNISGGEAISLTRSCRILKTAVGTIQYGTTTAVYLEDAGTDIPLKINLFYYDSNNDISDFTLSNRGASRTNWIFMQAISLWAQVDYMPYFEIIDDSNNNGVRAFIMDLDTYALMTEAQFNQFNDAAALSLYATVGIESQANFKSAKPRK